MEFDTEDQVLCFLYDAYRYLMTTISIKSLTLEGTHSDSVISSYLEGMSLQSLRHCSLKSVVVSSVPLVQHCSMCGILVVS